MTRPVLDVTAGTRAMWFDKTDRRTLFGDARTETITVTDRTRGRDAGETAAAIAARLHVRPDTLRVRCLRDERPDLAERLAAPPAPHPPPRTSARYRRGTAA